mmetsp:Transcript_43719/g.81562  ORF Transcript_43719/g.81562 Transcript_43719/m.81562 type:complete len:656 (-) Transcript_43719:233-2200(-)
MATTASYEVVTNDAQSTLDGWSVVEGSGTAAEAGEDRLRAEVALERDVVPFAAGELKAVLSVVAPHGNEGNDDKQAPLHLVAVLDKSGSMGGEKIRLVKQTMVFMLRYLSERDSLGIVEYGSDVKVAAPLTRCDSDGRARLKQAIERIQINGQTNLSGGLLKGLELHKTKPQHAGSSAGPMQQAVQVGNTYKRLPDQEAELRAARGEHFGRSDMPMPSDAERVHEWTMALRFARPEEQSLVKKVVFQLHETFRDPVVEVTTPPFELTRMGWGTFEVHATLYLHDGRELKVSHMLSFDRPETFRTVLLPLVQPQQSSGAWQERFWDLCGSSSADASGELNLPAVVRSTFLFTDGHANMGCKDTAGICAAASAMLRELGGCKSSISTFGFGSDHNADMLQQLADAGEGTYSHVQSEDQIAEAFGEALGGLLSTTHQNVSLCLQLAPGVSLARAYTTFPVVPEADNRVVVEVGDLFAEERRDILVSLNLPADTNESLRAIGGLEVRGFSVLKTRSESQSKALMLERRDQAEAVEAHEQVQRHWNRHVTNEALEKARAAAGKGNLKEAQVIIDAATNTLGSSALVQRGDAVSLGLLSDLQECRADLSHQDQYMHVGSKKMAMMQAMHSKQRAANGVDMSVEYSNMKMKSTRAAFKMSIA